MGRNDNTLNTNDAVLTPEDIFQVVIDALGPFGLDAAGNPDQIVPAHQIMLLEEYRERMAQLRYVHPAPPAVLAKILWGDALIDYESWAGYGLVWCNPPYSRLYTDRWLARMASADECVAFLPVRTTPRWWQEELVPTARVICFLNRKIAHVGEDFGAPFHQCLAYFGDRHDVFVAAMHAADMGWCVVLGEGVTNALIAHKVLPPFMLDD